MRLPALSDGKRFLDRSLGRIEVLTGMKRRHLLPVALVFVLMLSSLILFFVFRHRSHDPGGFGVPDDFGVLTAGTVLHPQSPLAPAIQAWKRGSPWVAIDLLRQAQTTRLAPDEHLAALNYAGHIRIWINDPGGAAASFRAGMAFKKNPGSAYGLGRVAELARDYALAVRHYEEAVGMRADFALAWRRLGDVRRVRLEWKDAVVAYTRSLEASSLDITRYRLGEALLGLGQKDEARPHFQYLHENARAPSLIGHAAARLADLEDTRGDLKRAAELYQQALRLCPDVAAFRHNLGNILVRAGQLDDAMAVYQALRAYSMRSKNPAIGDERIRQSLARAIGETWYDRQDPAAALRYLAEAEREDPEVSAMLGDLHLIRGEYDDALVHYGRVIATVPRTRLGLVALVNSGTIWLERMKPERALHAWKNALEIEPGSPRILCNTGLAYLALKDRQAAAGAFRKAWLLDTSLTNALALLAATSPAEEVISLLRDGDAARRIWFALQTLGRLYHRKREYGSAIDALQRALQVATRPAEADASRLLLARCRLARDDLDLAGRDLASLAERLSQEPLWLYQMGIAAWKSGSHTNAQSYFSLAGQSGARPRLAAAISYWLGNCAWKDGLVAKALEHYRSALKSNPAHTAAALNAAWCVRQLAAGGHETTRSRNNAGTLR